MFNDSALKQLVSISNPRMWFFYPVTYVLGVATGMFLLKETVNASVWVFILYIFWFIALGIVAGFVERERSHKVIFPSDLIHDFLCNKRNAGNNRLSSYISGFCLLFFFVSNLILQNSKICVLSISLFLLDFLLHSSGITKIVKAYVRMLYGMVLITPFLIGYIFITNTWPNIDCILAGILYGTAMGIYANAVEGEYTLFSKNTALVASGMLSIVCGSIFARYGVIYSLTVSSLLVVLGMSFFAKDSNEMHAIHAKAFYMHLIVGFVVGTYFFTH